MSHPEFRHTVWHKSSRSGGDGNCVEVAHTGALVGLRDSKDPTGPVIVLTRAHWTSVLAGIRQS